jgi:acyl-CoA thioester hydrolase
VIRVSSAYLCKKVMMAHEGRGWGRFEGCVHILPIRVYYEDTDLSGVVYHANYLRFMERGRSEFFRCAGILRLAMMDRDEATVWTLRSASLTFHRPARVDDLVEMHTRATALSGARMTADQKIYRAGELLAHGAVEACIITLEGKPRRIPDDIRAKLLPLVSPANV